jgi:hypothetical protein
MKIPSYLQKNRYGIFHFRRAVPSLLRNTIGKREIICSLYTREPREAVHLSRLFAIHVEQLFQEVRMGKKSGIRTNWTTEYNPDGSISSFTADPEEAIVLKEAGKIFSAPIHTELKTSRIYY